MKEERGEKVKYKIYSMDVLADNTTIYSVVDETNKKYRATIHTDNTKEIVPTEDKDYVRFEDLTEGFIIEGNTDD